MAMKLELKSVQPASYASAYIETFITLPNGENERSSTATGFIYKHEMANRSFLITNWHVLTGRNPDDPRFFIKGHPPISPRYLTLWMAGLPDKLHFKPACFDLYAQDKPIWLEAKEIGGRVDLVAIPLTFPESVHVVAINDFAELGGPVEPGQDVIIVGFPYERILGNPFPIWKSALIASEPGIFLDGRPRFVLDSPGRPGMSGSPIYAISKGISISKTAAKIFNDPTASSLDKLTRIDPSDFGGEANMLRFIGVYSGSYGDDKKSDPLREMGLGFAWPAPLVDRILEDLVPGENPFPPDFNLISK